MTKQELKNEILKKKKQNNVCIIAHSYQTEDITEIADFVGDSYGLAVKAAKIDAPVLLMCGVRFMAETAKILSPDKKVIIANGDAGCPMAEQMGKEDVLALKELFPDYSVACYVNTTAELKTVCDVCVTSSSAVKVLKEYENDKFIFIPDKNLGSYVKEQLPEKKFFLVNGCCPVHSLVTEEDVIKAKENHPNCPLLVHPECIPSVVAQADFVGSTADIMKYSRNSNEKAFIICTEKAIAEHLKAEIPEKEFYVATEKLVCNDMKLTTLEDVYAALTGKGGKEINLDNETLLNARKCIDEMIRLG